MTGEGSPEQAKLGEHIPTTKIPDSNEIHCIISSQLSNPYMIDFLKFDAEETNLYHAGQNSSGVGRL